MTFMRFSGLLHVAFWGVGKVSALLRRPRPLRWLTITGSEPGSQRSVTVALHQVDGSSYVIDLHTSGPPYIDVRPFRSRGSDFPRTGWASFARASGRGTLTTEGTDLDVTLTEVTDPAVKRQVLTVGMTEYVAGGLAVGMSRFAVFEVTLGAAEGVRPGSRSLDSGGRSWPIS
jgi:hypothetical protein